MPQKKKRSELDAANLGKAELGRKLENELTHKAEILNREYSYKFLNKNEIEVTAEFVCKENIAQKAVIDKIENMDYN